ncbi:MAG TPA: NfeD family protein [Gemmatimonadales bacterium]|nr:NfeD family protein [Gemmatimonadales bacterium]
MRRGLGAAGLLLVGAGLWITAPVAAQGRLVYRLDVHGTIENGLAPYVARGLRLANERGAAAVYLDIDTPGGRVDAAERIADAVRASRVPVYAWVNPRAYSAGALIALATQGIYMRSGGVLGAATPVDGRGTKLPEKYVSAMRAEFRALAEARGLDPRIAEAMVDEAVGVPGLVEPGKLLTLSTSEALRVKYARAEVNSESELLAALGLGGARVEAVELNWAELVVRFLNHPVVSSLLLSIGVLALLAEVKAGTHGLGLLVGLGSLGLFFGSSLLLGLAGLEEVILLGLGLVAVGVEVFLLPGFGVAGVLGALLIGAAVVLAMLGNMPTATDVVQALAVLGASVLLTLVIAFTWLRHLPHSRRFGGLIHQTSAQAAEGFVSALPRADLVGRVGVAVSDLRPAGVANVDGERIDVVTEGEYIAAGTRVTVVRAEGYRHVVRAAGA